MAMEVKSGSFPTYYNLVFDDISKLGEYDHELAFYVSFKKFFESLRVIFGCDACFRFFNIDNSKKGENWIGISKIFEDEEIDRISKMIYYHEEFEIDLEIKIGNIFYKGFIYTDPVVFEIKKLNK